VIAGYGRVGQTFADILTVEDAELIALDLDVKRVLDARSAGQAVFVGDASRPEILEIAGIDNAALFIVTVDSAVAAEAMVRAARSLRGDLVILARAQDADHAQLLLDSGADYVIPDAIEAGLQLAGRALLEFGYATETVRDRLAAGRDTEYRRVALE